MKRRNIDVKKMKRILSAVMALLLVVALSATAFAEEYNIDEGDIQVTAKSDGKQYVTQTAKGFTDVEQTSETIITQTDSSTATSNTVTINAESGATAEVTLDGVNIDISGKKKAAVSTKGEGDVSVELDKKNTIQSGNEHAGLEKNNTGELTITDSNGVDGSLDATGGDSGAGIGGGDYKGSSNIMITGGDVIAQGGQCAAGIGGGRSGNCSNITIWGDAQVSANGGRDADVVGAGAPIGNGGHWESGGEGVKPDTSELTADGSVNGTSGKHVHTWDEGTVTVEPTCAEAGVITYTCTAGKGFTKTEEIPATGEHTWENGVCSVCGEPEPISAPEDSDAQSAPLYRVTDKNDNDIGYKAEQKDGVLTITVNERFAILTGELWGINTLRAQGVEKIVFVTKNGTSIFTLTKLLEKGSRGEEYKLTHSGKTVTFTFGTSNIDISDILEKE
jgi:uncharacterized protein YxeA